MGNVNRKTKRVERKGCTFRKGAREGITEASPERGCEDGEALGRKGTVGRENAPWDGCT